MSNLVKRAATGIIYVGAIVGCILWGSAGVLLLTILFSALGIAEFVTLSDHNQAPRATFILDIAGAMLLTFSIAMCYSPLPLATPLFMLSWLLWLLGRMTTELYIHEGDALNKLCHSLTAQVYIALPLGLLNLLNVVSWKVTLLMFVLIWLNDTGAFIVGSSCGRRKLFERISPKKSWEGFWGGMAFCIACSTGAYYLIPGFDSIMPLGCWIGYGVVVSVFATWGDLVESMFKRALGVKDSGHLLPGHGGILDRIDSLLFVCPLTFIYLVIVRALF
ncbi:MAG: phosphatidate cytidylyltransferase [Muribaculaceae bacterium]|nr:phosphatidate cytidylyltransferase [Muribaculaceae bacterium]MDE6644921.1 phosphatidate cytidylyltransferase [Muribaculaceae bacterium]